MASTVNHTQSGIDNPFVDGGESPGADAVWVLISSFIIFTMQSGFALFESGLVCLKNESNVMMKNMLDVMLGGLSFWFIGFGLAFGYNNGDSKTFVGGSNFGWNTVNVSDEGHVHAKYFFQLSFATTATTIVSGGVAERVKLKAYMIFVVINTGLVYPFPAHWIWHEDGWLAKLGAFDFAGSCVVHLSGGSAAFAAAAVLGPRHRRFGTARKLFLMANPTNVVLGTFFLWWGWIGFNAGSTYGVSGSMWKIAARTCVVTMNGAMAGGLSAVLLSAALKRKRGYLVDIPQTMSGILGGLVAITAGAAVIEPWEGVVIGFIGGVVANAGIWLVAAANVDDPAGCVGVHWFAGVWGMVATGLFTQIDDVAQLAPESGILRKGVGNILVANLAACICVTIWSATLTAAQCLLMKHTIGFRMHVNDEMLGSDFVEHNVTTGDILDCANANRHTFGVQRVKPADTNTVIEQILAQPLKGHNSVTSPVEDDTDGTHVTTTTPNSFTIHHS